MRLARAIAACFGFLAPDDLPQPVVPGLATPPGADLRGRTGTEQAAQRPVALFGDAAQAFPAASGMRSRRQPRPGRQVPAGFEAGDIGQRANQCACGHRACARDRLQALCGFVRLCIGADVCGQGLDLLLRVGPLISQQVQGLPRQSGKTGPPCAPTGPSRMRCTGNWTCRSARMARATERIRAGQHRRPSTPRAGRGPARWIQEFAVNQAEAGEVGRQISSQSSRELTRRLTQTRWPCPGIEAGHRRGEASTRQGPRGIG